MPKAQFWGTKQSEQCKLQMTIRKTHLHILWAEIILKTRQNGILWIFLQFKLAMMAYSIFCYPWLPLKVIRTIEKTFNSPFRPKFETCLLINCHGFLLISSSVLSILEKNVSIPCKILNIEPLVHLVDLFCNLSAGIL